MKQLIKDFLSGNPRVRPTAKAAIPRLSEIGFLRPPAASLCEASEITEKLGMG